MLNIEKVKLEDKNRFDESGELKSNRKYRDPNEGTVFLLLNLGFNHIIAPILLIIIGAEAITNSYNLNEQMALSVLLFLLAIFPAYAMWLCVKAESTYQINTWGKYNRAVIAISCYTVGPVLVMIVYYVVRYFELRDEN